MSNQRKIGEYDKNNDFTILLPKATLPQVSGSTAGFLKYMLKSSLNYVIEYGIKKSINFSSFTALEIEDEPTLLPLKYYENSKPFDENISIDELKKIMIKKNDWPYPTINTYHEAYINKQITPSEIADRIIKLCQSEIITKYNAIAEIHTEDIIKAAKESTERYENGTHLSLIDGVPFFVKEHIHIKGYKTYYGVSAFAKLRKNTAFIIQKLLDAGAILIGTTCMPALGANNIGVNTDSRFASPPNPWNNERYAGGSSTGNGVVLALGLCPFAIGSDFIGSMRVPAGWCGVVAFRPTFSRVSNNGSHKNKIKDSIYVLGPMSCCVSDAAIILHIISGPDKNFDVGLNQPELILPDFKNFHISSIKFGLYRDYINLSEKVQLDNFNNVIMFLKNQGCFIKEIILSEIVNCAIASIIEMAVNLPSTINMLQKYSNFTDFPDISLLLLNALSTKFTENDKITVKKQRTRMIKILETLFEEIDVIILLTTSRLPAIKSLCHQNHGFVDSDIFTHSFHYCSLSTFTGIPSISINIGHDIDTNLPISLQLMTKWWREDILFVVADKIENQFPLTKRPLDFQNIF